MELYDKHFRCMEVNPGRQKNAQQLLAIPLGNKDHVNRNIQVNFPGFTSIHQKCLSSYILNVTTNALWTQSLTERDVLALSLTQCFRKNCYAQRSREGQESSRNFKFS